MSRIPIALTIAGSDSGGGAGIQADIKAMSANGVYAASAVTALTAQNTLGVTAIHDVPADFVTAQIDAVFSDLAVDAVKIGMLSQPDIIRAVADVLRRWRPRHVVLDPVMVATSGAVLIADDAVEVLVGELFPLATVVTPNMHEAARLTGRPVSDKDAAMVGQARAILAMGTQAVLLKGGHGSGPLSRDLLLTDSGETWFEAPRIATRNTHGTGCSLSSAIAANLAKGMSLENAVHDAKHWLTGALRAADRLAVGSGPGPVHHFHNLWPVPDGGQ
jgi:hydroxymethylpyrimidine/phosphomethylpyrimidine kinase